MKVCIIGSGLISLSLANVLIQKGLKVEILLIKKVSKYNKLRTIGISKSNIDYFNNEIINIEKISWKINNIKIYTEKSRNDRILEFNEKNKQIFSILKNYKLQKILESNLKKSKLIKFKNNLNYQQILKRNYNLIINCDPNHEITKKFFSNKIEKSYNSLAYITIIYHKKFKNNNTAFQKFTNFGPIAFLPISETETSIVYSLKSKNKKKETEIEDLIKKYNPIYSILKIEKGSFFELKSSNLRNYYKNNILAFGDLLHRIHPLAGQGFNMSLRDIKVISSLIDSRMNLGLELDGSLCRDFQKSSKDKNYIFSIGIDWIYEFFNLENKINSNLLNKSINVIGKNKSLNSFFKKFADNGLNIY